MRQTKNGVPLIKFKKGKSVDFLMDVAHHVTTKIEEPSMTIEASKIFQIKPKTTYQDYIFGFDHNGKIVVKHICAYHKKKIMKNMCIPNMFVTNPLGPKGVWVPKTQA